MRIDNTVGENEKKYWASTIQLFAGENGSYFANKQHVKLFYGDVIANVDKRLGKDFTLAANVGASWSRERSDLVGGGGKLDIANFFTLNNIIKEYRLAKAEQLLTSTKLSIDEIIYKAGFVNRGTFFKCFAAKYGCTPKVYRKEKLSQIKQEVDELPEEPQEKA